MVAGEHRDVKANRRKRPLRERRPTDAEVAQTAPLWRLSKTQ